MTIMLKAYHRASMMGCSIEPDPRVLEARTEMGLVRGHAYSITKVVKAPIETPRVKGEIQIFFNMEFLNEIPLALHCKVHPFTRSILINTILQSYYYCNLMLI
jgi:hypothetical protein